MKLKNYLCFLSILLTTLFSSCSLQKRHYRDGFYIESKSKEQTTTINKKDSSGASPLDSVQKKIIVLNKDPKYKHDCDTLFLVDGTTLICKIDEVTKRSVRFKNCTDSNEIINSIDAELVSGIKFNNGRELIISKTTGNIKPLNAKNNYLIKDALVDTGFILAILAIIFELILLLALFNVILIAPYLAILLIVFNALAAIIAIVIGFRSLLEIRKNPDIFKGKKMTTWEIVLGLLSLVSWLIILIAITI